MKIYRSNRVEALLDSMLEVLRHPQDSPFASECIVVQSKGMSAWLSMQLSRRFGVWANPDFPHPRQFIQRILRATLGADGNLVQRYSRERLVFVIFDLLAQCATEPAFHPLSSYLSGDSPAKKLQLCRQLAHLFDQYAVYRPEMVLAWEEGDYLAHGRDLGADGWQPELWRRIVARIGCCSPARLMVQARIALASSVIPFPDQLPERLSIFGIDTLPRIYLAIINELARVTPVHLFLFSPAEGYFADIRSSAELKRIQAKSPEYHVSLDLHWETGNPLLASLGMLARDFQLMLEEDCAYLDMGDHFALHESPATMLEVLQDDIHRLNQRCSADAGCLPKILADGDSSLMLHACHGRLREVEVLQDQLLSLFQTDPSLNPREILVMLPDVGLYAPLIEAVFSVPDGDRRQIPYRIADRPGGSDAYLVDIFFQLLELASGRITAPELMELFSCAAVRDRFGIASEELPLIRHWLDKSGIRWGMDEEHRERFGQPRDRQNTWRFGFDRMVLGYALRSDGDFFADVLPCEGIEGQGAELAGRFIHYCETLFSQLESIAGRRTIREWQILLAGLLDSLFLVERTQEWQLQKILDAMAEIVSEAEESSPALEFALADLIILLREKLYREAHSQGFMAGGLTFCGMLPMRTVPFKVICLLGMNDGEFPRVEHPQGHDLVARYPEVGDRSRRNDDRYLFLEALLAAREKLLIFYVGSSSRDGKNLPPAVVVEELIDTLSDSFLLAGESESSPAERRKLLLKRLSVRHPLQPFSLRYFDGKHRGLFSFAQDYCAAAAAKEKGRSVYGKFLPAPLPFSPEAPARITMADLHRCLARPARWFLENRLSLFLEEREEALAEREPVNLVELERYHLARELLGARREGHGEALHILARWRGEGRVPLGASACAVFAELDETVQPIVSRLSPFEVSGKLPPLSGEARLGPRLVVAGELSERYAAGLIRGTNSSLHGRVLLAAWLDHLFLCAVNPADQQLETIIVGKGEKGSADGARLRFASEAGKHLAVFSQIFFAASREPLLFFPKSSYAFARAFSGGRGSEESRFKAACKKARDAYTGSAFVVGEGADPCCRQLFRDEIPIGEGYSPYQAGVPAFDFADLAMLVFGPMLEHLEDLS